MIARHDQVVTNHYVIHYPEHSPRAGDPNYRLFNAYHKAHSATAICMVGEALGYDQCADAKGQPMLWQSVVDPAVPHLGLELHHKVIEFATINDVDLVAFTKDHPTVTSLAQLTAWAETAENFVWLCAKHHRGAGGIHHAAAADWAAELYIRDLVGPFTK